VPIVAEGGVDCWRCGLPILPDSEWHLGHDDHDRSKYRGPEHTWCNSATAGRRDQTRRQVNPPDVSGFSQTKGHPQDPAPSLSLSPSGKSDMVIRPELTWNPDVLARYEWLEPFCEVPEDAAPPLAMSPPPPGGLYTVVSGVRLRRVLAQPEREALETIVAQAHRLVPEAAEGQELGLPAFRC
jgi:hypothetical protein